MPAKDTEQLENELRNADSLEKFDAENAENFRKYTLAEYLEKLLEEKNLSKTEIVKISQLGDYAYHIFAGRKNSSRKNILSLALAMKLSPDETNYLLYYAGHKKLYVRDAWDHVIWYALQNGNNIFETNDLLSASELYPLLGNLN